MKTTHSISQSLLEMLRREGCRTIFGVPGAYSIHFVDTCTTPAPDSDRSPLDFVLASHEGGAAFMAQGYSQVTGVLGCVVTTAGPAAMNTVAALASAKSDGDRVLLVHGEVPRGKRGQGLLQDATAFGCDIRKIIAPVVHDQFVIDSASDYVAEIDCISESLASARRTTHLQISADVFSAQVARSAKTPTQIERPCTVIEPDLADALARVEDLLIHSPSIFVLAGHGIYQAKAIQELEAFLDPLEIPTMVTARAAACLDSARPYYLGQHSIFSHRRVDEILKSFGGKKTDLLLVLGSSLGEFSSNAAAPYLREIPNLVHVNLDEKCFGRLRKHALNLKMDVKSFLARMASSPRLASHREAIRGRSHERLARIQATTSSVLHSRLAPDATYEIAALSGRKLVHRVSEALNQYLHPTDAPAPEPKPRVNVVADTGSAKLYAAHYFSYRPGDRCILNSGSIDCLGFGLSAAIGAAIGSRDLGEDALTICFVGDGGLLMNNELNTLAANAALRGLKLLVFVLNDASLSYVHQGFAAVMGRPLEATRFHRRIDFAAMAASFGLAACTVGSEHHITPGFFAKIYERNEFPMVVDCQISNRTIGPGLARYNQVRSLLGKTPLTPTEMEATLGP